MGIFGVNRDHKEHSDYSDCSDYFDYSDYSDCLSDYSRIEMEIMLRFVV